MLSTAGAGTSADALSTVDGATLPVVLDAAVPSPSGAAVEGAAGVLSAALTGSPSTASGVPSAPAPAAASDAVRSAFWSLERSARGSVSGCSSCGS